MMIPLIMMLIIAAIFPVAIEIALNTILIIDKMTVTVHAHPRPLSNPYATTNETIAIARSIMPNACLSLQVRIEKPWEGRQEVVQGLVQQLGSLVVQID